MPTLFVGSRLVDLSVLFPLSLNSWYLLYEEMRPVLGFVTSKCGSSQIKAERMYHKCSVLPGLHQDSLHISATFKLTLLSVARLRLDMKPSGHLTWTMHTEQIALLFVQFINLVTTYHSSALNLNGCDKTPAILTNTHIFPTPTLILMSPFSLTQIKIVKFHLMG